MDETVYFQRYLKLDILARLGVGYLTLLFHALNETKNFQKKTVRNVYIQFYVILKISGMPDQCAFELPVSSLLLGT